MSRDEDSYPVWIEHVEGQMDEWQDLDDGECRKRIRESLRPPASGIISDLRREKPGATSHDYLRALDLAFGETETDDELFVKFHSTVQREGELPSEYLSRLQEMMRCVVRRGVVKAQDANLTRLKQFIRGILYDGMLLVNLQLRERLGAPPTFLELLSSVRKQEEEDKTKAELSGLSAAKGSGKAKQALPHKAQVSHPDFQAQSSTKPADPLQNATPPHPSAIICFKCGEVGHISKECSATIISPDSLNKKLIRFISQNQGNGKGLLENTKGSQ